MTSDSDLVRQAQRGERRAYEELVRRWSARAGGVSRQDPLGSHRGGSRSGGAVAQACGRWGRLTIRRSSVPGYAASRREVALDWIKSSQSRQVSLDAMANGGAEAWVVQGGDSPAEAAARADDERQLLDEVAVLPDPYREVILMYYYDDVTYHDVAALLGVSAATVNARLTKARAMLRERLSGVER